MKNSNSTKQKVFKLVKEFLENKTEGATYSEIIKYLENQLPDVPKNTLQGSFWQFRQRVIQGQEKDVYIPDKGLYILTKYYSNSKVVVEEKPTQRIKEEDFYDKFAKYLVENLEECTRAISLGGNKFQDRWGTPDVLGVYKFSEADPIRPPLEIISAEIKLDTNQLITAFGQACCYKLFSHKVYLVVPKEATSDIARLESLCMRFGIGLILFDSKNPDNPEFEIRTRAVKSEPDYYYVNAYIKKLSNEDIKNLMR